MLMHGVAHPYDHYGPLYVAAAYLVHPKPSWSNQVWQRGVAGPFTAPAGACPLEGVLL
jgi:hypothetical protein